MDAATEPQYPATSTPKLDSRDTGTRHGPSSALSCADCSGVAAFTAPVLAAAVFVVEYTFGGNDDVSIGAVAGSMIGVHVLIGIGEGIITVLAVGAVMTTSSCSCPRTPTRTRTASPR